MSLISFILGIIFPVAVDKVTRISHLSFLVFLQPLPHDPLVLACVLVIVMGRLSRGLDASTDQGRDWYTAAESREDWAAMCQSS